MAETGNGEGKEPQPQEEPCYEAVIRFFPMRNFVAVEGPTDCPVVFLGMLQQAIIIVGKTLNVGMQDGPLVTPPGPGELLRRGFHRRKRPS